jgi:hypothetical protein
MESPSTRIIDKWSAVNGPRRAPVSALIQSTIPGQIVADITLAGPPHELGGGAIGLEIEALTVAE